MKMANVCVRAFLANQQGYILGWHSEKITQQKNSICNCYRCTFRPVTERSPRIENQQQIWGGWIRRDAMLMPRADTFGNLSLQEGIRVSMFYSGSEPDKEVRVNRLALIMTFYMCLFIGVKEVEGRGGGQLFSSPP